MVLLQYGADPNAGFLSQGETPPFTALTGLFGNGEQGSVSDPPHPHAIRLATCCSRREPIRTKARASTTGCSPRTMTIWSCCSATDSAPGTAASGTESCRARLDSPAIMLRGQLIWAITHDMTSRIRGCSPTMASPTWSPHWGLIRLAPRNKPFDPRRSSRCSPARSRSPSCWLNWAPPPATDSQTRDCWRRSSETRPGSGRGNRGSRSRGLWRGVRAAHPSLVLRAACALIEWSGCPRMLGTSGLRTSTPAVARSPDRAGSGRRPHTVPSGEAGWNSPRYYSILVPIPAHTTVRFDATPLGWAQFFGQSELVQPALEPLTPT